MKGTSRTLPGRRTFMPVALLPAIILAAAVLVAAFAHVSAYADPAAGLAPPTLLLPEDGSDCQGTSGTLDWSDVPLAVGYRVQLGTSCGTGTEYTTTTSEFHFSSRVPGTTYYWRVKTRDSGGTFGDYSACFQFTVAPPVLSAPTLETPAHGSTCQTSAGTLDWADVPGATAYLIQLGTTCGFGTEVEVTKSVYDYSALLPGTNYFWHVKTRDACGNYGSYSSCFQFSTQPSLGTATLQSPPDGSACQAASGLLNWTPVSGAAGYRVQFDTSCGSGTEHEVTSSEFPYSGLEPDSTYYWRVQVVDACGHIGAYTTCFSFVAAETVPGVPALLTPPDLSSCQSTAGVLDWEDVPEAASYRVQLGTSCGSGTERDVTTSQYAFSSLNPGMTYYWRVKSRNSCGQYGSYSGCFSLTVAPTTRPAPTLQSPLNDSLCVSSSGMLNWNDVTGATAYTVQIGTSCGSGPEVEVPSSDYAYSELTPGTTYYWHVKTKDTCGLYGTYSSCFHFTTAPAPLVAPTPQAPPDGAACQGFSGTLNWPDVAGATGYRVQVGTSCEKGPEVDVPLSQFGYSALAPSTTYYWRVKTKDTCGQFGSYSSCFSFTTTTPVLAAPEPATPPDSSTCAPLSGMLDWEDAPGAVAYHVQLGLVCGGGVEQEVTTSQIPYTDLEPGRSYFWSVQAVDSCAHEGASSDCFTFLTTHGQLVAPTLLSPSSGVTCAGATGLVDWSDVPSAAGYRVQIGTSCDVGTEYDVTSSQYLYSGLVPGTLYYWRVRTKDICGELGPYSACFTFTVGSGVATPPELQSPAGGDSCQAVSGVLDWADVPSGAGYRVQLGTSCGTGTEYEVTASQYPFSGLAPGTTYYWRVQTKDGCGGYGEYSKCLSFTTNQVVFSVLVNPSPASDAHCVDRNAPLTWGSVPGAVHYRVQLDDKPGFTGELVADTTITTASLTLPLDFLAEGTSYFWRVRAEGSCGQVGPWPEPAWGFKTARLYAVSGRIVDSKGNPVAGVHFVGAPGDRETDADGRYQLVVPCGWSATVFPQLAGFAFSPASRSYTDIGVDSENQDYVGGMDETPPTFSIRYLQNPIVTNELDLFGVADEPLLPGTPHCTVNETDLVTTLTDTSAAVCLAQYRLPASGDFTICFAGSDPAGNDGQTCRTISAANLLAARGGQLEDHSGAFVLNVSADALVSDVFLTVSKDPGGAALGVATPSAARVTSWKLGPPGFHFVRAVRVRASAGGAAGAGLAGTPLSHVAIAVETPGGWTMLPTRFDAATGWMEADISETGTYGLVTSDHEVSTPMEPRSFRLAAANPVPFMRQGAFLYDLPSDTRVEIAIYDAAGRRVRTLVQEQKTAGSYSVAWDGMNGDGQPVSGGMYFARMSCEGASRTTRVLLVR